MPNKEVSYGVTAFLDILGFSDRVLKATDTGHIAAVVKDVRKVQEAFEYRPKDKHDREAQKASEKTVLAFSDCVVVNIALKSQMSELAGTFDSIMSELSGMALTQGQLVVEGLFLRGGVDLGWWYRKGSVLVSESLVRAYNAETTGDVPVIRLTDHLYGYFSNHPDRRFYSDDTEPIKRVLRRYRREGPNGKLEFWYLDYITIVAESVDWNPTAAQRKVYNAAKSEARQRMMDEGHKTSVNGWFKSHARAIEKAYAAAKSDSVKGKYAWLSGYHNEIAANFTEEPQCRCKVA